MFLLSSRTRLTALYPAASCLRTKIIPADFFQADGITGIRVTSQSSGAKNSYN